MGKTINPEQELRKDYENTVYEYPSDYQPRPAYVDGQYIDVKYTSILARSPTPQASFSNEGSYNPCFFGSIFI